MKLQIFRDPPGHHHVPQKLRLRDVPERLAVLAVPGEVVSHEEQVFVARTRVDVRGEHGALAVGERGESLPADRLHHLPRRVHGNDRYPVVTREEHEVAVHIPGDEAPAPLVNLQEGILRHLPGAPGVKRRLGRLLEHLHRDGEFFTLCLKPLQYFELKLMVRRDVVALPQKDERRIGEFLDHVLHVEPLPVFHADGLGNGASGKGGNE
jgi:hypothetical protein